MLTLLACVWMGLAEEKKSTTWIAATREERSDGSAHTSSAPGNLRLSHVPAQKVKIQIEESEERSREGGTMVLEGVGSGRQQPSVV